VCTNSFQHACFRKERGEWKVTRNVVELKFSRAIAAISRDRVFVVESGTDASRLGPLKKLFSLLTSTVEATSSAGQYVQKYGTVTQQPASQQQ
jgi:hypothetical protein